MAACPGPSGQQSEVTEALEELRRRNLLGFSEKLGYKIQSTAGEEWERERRDIPVAGETKSEIVQDGLKYLLADPTRPRLQGRSFPWAAVFSDGRKFADASLLDPRAEATVRVDFRYLILQERTESEWIRRSEESALHDRVVWVCGDTGQVDQQAQELARSRTMIRKLKPRRESLSAARKLLLQQEENRAEDLERERRSPPPGWRGGCIFAARHFHRASTARRSSAPCWRSPRGCSRTCTRTSCPRWWSPASCCNWWSSSCPDRRPSKASLLEWVRSLTPMDAQDLEFVADFQGRVLVHLVEANGERVSAYSASDGTLRFLALVAALLSPDTGRLFFFEEFDNGIHPTRLHLLLQLVMQACQQREVQVIGTTHNPALLAFLERDARKAALLVVRSEGDPASRVVPIVELPDLNRILDTQDLGRLHAAGWLEDAALFSEPDSTGEAE